MSDSRTTLFKLDARNQVRVWTIWVEHHPSKSVVLTRHGVNGSRLTIDTTEYTQYDHETLANNYVTSKTKYMQARRGYTVDIPISKPYRPMLLQKYENHAHNIPDTVYLQPKLNGMRCLASSSWLMSRTGEYYCLPHIQSLLASLPEEVVLDGELYVHGLPLQNLMELVKRHEPLPESAKVSFYVFDIVLENATQQERNDILREYLPLPHYPHSTPEPGVYRLSTRVITDQIGIYPAFQEYLSNRYEGAVIRLPAGMYDINCRSSSVLKLKPIQTMNCKILDVIRCERAPTHGKLVLENPNGGPFTCTFKAPHFQRIALLKNKQRVIGKLCQVEYEDFSEDNKPLKPVGVHIHGGF